MLYFTLLSLFLNTDLWLYKCAAIKRWYDVFSALFRSSFITLDWKEKLHLLFHPFLSYLPSLLRPPPTPPPVLCAVWFTICRQCNLLAGTARPACSLSFQLNNLFLFLNKRPRTGPRVQQHKRRRRDLSWWVTWIQSFTLCFLALACKLKWVWPALPTDLLKF